MMEPILWRVRLLPSEVSFRVDGENPAIFADFPGTIRPFDLSHDDGLARIADCVIDFSSYPQIEIPFPHQCSRRRYLPYSQVGRVQVRFGRSMANNNHGPVRHHGDGAHKLNLRIALRHTPGNFAI